VDGQDGRLDTIRSWTVGKVLRERILVGCRLGRSAFLRVGIGFCIWWGWDDGIDEKEGLEDLRWKGGGEWEWYRWNGMECWGWCLLRLLALQTQSSLS
jgi:hypothetical protein